MTAASQIFTVGHSTHPAEKFVALTSAHGVEVVCDVRRYPASRRNPQFNGGALAESLRAAGVAYEPFGDGLGGRRESTAPSEVGGGNPFQAYTEHMRSAEFAAGLSALEDLARERRAAVMCAEGDWRRCHRRLISDALVSRGWRVIHIGPDGVLEEHVPTLGLD